MFYQDEELIEQFKDAKFAKRYGKYLGTYISENEQLRVDLCLEQLGVTAHLQPLNGLHEDDVTDMWWKPVNDIVRELGHPRVFAINHGYQYYK